MLMLLERQSKVAAAPVAEDRIGASEAVPVRGGRGLASVGVRTDSQNPHGLLALSCLWFQRHWKSNMDGDRSQLR